MPPFVASSAGPFRFGRTVFDRIVGFLIATAVLYYVSCCLLLLGAYSMMHSPLLPGGFLMQYCETCGIFLAYVILLTVLCLLVLRRLSLAEDGLVMAGMSLLLTLDPTFFDNVFYTYTRHVGLLVNSFCFVLALCLYAAQIKIGGVPWTRRTVLLTALVAGFVFYYPLGLDLTKAYTEAHTEHYFYLLWWMPLLVAVVCERMLAMQKQQTQAQSQTPKLADGVIPESMQRKFLIASMMILFYIVLSHLLEADHTYTRDFHVEYLTPVILSVGLLLFKLSPALFFKLSPKMNVWVQYPQHSPGATPPPQSVAVPGVEVGAEAPPQPRFGDVGHPAPTLKLTSDLGAQGKQLIFLFAFFAACCSLPNSESLIVHLHLPRAYEMVVSPFRFGLGAVVMYFLYFWNIYRDRFNALAALVCMVAAVSGASFSDAITHVTEFHFAPYLLLAVVFTVWSMIDATFVFPTLAGGCLIIALLAKLPPQDQDCYKVVLFGQLWALWIGAMQWRYHRLARQGNYSVLGTFVFVLAVAMCVFGSHPRAWGADLLAVTLGLFCAGWFLQNSYLFTLSLLGAVGTPVHFAQNHISSVLAATHRHYGLMMTALAFVTLPLAYFMSVLKRRRLG